ncbi:MAG: UbiA family prenyltransferase [Candidatus Aenigmatarchaeota archaeon]
MENLHVFAIKEFLSFIRPENCFFTAGIAVSGYMIFNQANAVLLPLFLAIFCGTGASYAYNHLTDKAEDAINRSRLNAFVLDGKRGRNAVAALYLTGLAFSIFTSFMSLLVYLFLLLISFLYSGDARLKEKFIVKNVNTGMGIALSFLVGAMAGGLASADMLLYVLIVFMLGFAANVLGDIKGCIGDKAIGMKTLPILLGTEKTKVIIYSVVSLMSVLVVALGYAAFYPLLPFMAAAIFLLHAGRMKATRASLLSSFTFLPLMLVLTKIIGGG